MAITKRYNEIDKDSGWCELGMCKLRRLIKVLKEDGTEIGRTSRHRYVLSPFVESYSHDTKSWSYTATDISKEDAI